jgi:hypothetical protein
MIFEKTFKKNIYPHFFYTYRNENKNLSEESLWQSITQYDLAKHPEYITVGQNVRRRPRDFPELSLKVFPPKKKRKVTFTGVPKRRILQKIIPRMLM